MAYHVAWILLLLTGADGLIIEQTKNQVDKPSSDYYFIAPDLSRQNSFVFATTNKTVKAPLESRIDVVTVVDSNLTYMKCSLTLRANINAGSIGLSSLKRLSANKLLLETFEQIKSGNRYTTLVFLDMDNCKITFPLPLQLSDKNVIHTRDTYSDRFVLFSADKAACKNVGNKCLINFWGGFYTVEPLEVDLLWPSLRIERTFTDHMYLMCGLNGSGVYQVELFTSFTNNTRKNLVSLSYVEGMKIITSDLAVCWILDSSKPQTIVYCSQFNQKGVLIFSSTIAYEKRMNLIFLYSVRPGRIILLTGERIGIGSSSWNILITTVERDNSSKPSNGHLLQSACTTTQMVFNARVIKEMIEIEYLCLDYNNKFLHNTISIVNK